MRKLLSSPITAAMLAASLGFTASLGFAGCDSGDSGSAQDTAGDSVGTNGIGADAVTHDAMNHDAMNHDAMNHDSSEATDAKTTSPSMMTTASGTFVVGYAPAATDIPVGSEFSLTLSFMDGAGAAVSATDVSIDARMPDHGHGMTVQPDITTGQDNAVVAEPMFFQMPGWWEVEVTATVNGTTDSATFDIVCGAQACGL